MPYTPILATLGYVLSPDGRRVLMIHRNAREDDHHHGKCTARSARKRASNVWI
jgi:8-oxo-dGTP diphosphatase